MSEANAVALIFSDGDSSRMLREVIGAIGCPIAYEASVAAFTPQALEESGANIVLVDLGPDAETNAIFDLVDDDRYRVIVNDAEVTSALSGWDHARWARHLAAKILQLPAAVDPPRPEEASVAAVDAIASMKPKSESLSQEPVGETTKLSSSGVDLGIDDWLSEVLQVKNPAGLFAETGSNDKDQSDPTEDVSNMPGAPSSGLHIRPGSDQDSTVTAASAPASVNPVAESAKPAAEERFDVNIDNVLRDIEGWLPPADSGVTRLDSMGMSRSAAMSLDDRESSATRNEPQVVKPCQSEDSRRTLSTASFSASGIASVNGSRDGQLARSLELMPMEEALLTALGDDQSPQPVREMIVDVVPPPATVSRVIVLCASVGGPEAIRDLLGAIPANHQALFLVVQQVGEEFLDLLSQQLRRTTALRVRSADLGDQLRDGEVVAVPPLQRLVIDRSGRVTLNQRADDVKESRIDQILRDVSDHFGEDCTVIVLSGVDSDAANGCRYVAGRGGQVWAQAPASCASSGMVTQVQQTGVVTFLGTPTELAAQLLLNRY